MDGEQLLDNKVTLKVPTESHDLLQAIINHGYFKLTPTEYKDWDFFVSEIYSLDKNHPGAWGFDIFGTPPDYESEKVEYPTVFCGQLKASSWGSNLTELTIETGDVLLDWLDIIEVKVRQMYPETGPAKMENEAVEIDSASPEDYRPGPWDWATDPRDKQFIKLRWEGKKASDIAKLFHLTPKRISNRFGEIKREYKRPDILPTKDELRKIKNGELDARSIDWGTRATKLGSAGN